QHRPQDIEQVVAPVLAGDADMVIGSRFIGREAGKNIPRWRMAGQVALNFATSVGARYGATDSQSGFRAFSPRAMRLMCEELRSSGFSVESEMQFVAGEHGLRTVETPIVVDYDIAMKRSPVTHGLEVLNGILRAVAQARPLLFISLPGFILLTLGVALGTMVVSIYASRGELAVGYGLITVLLLVIGVLALFVGIVLHTMRSLFQSLSRRLQ
ncbi:MAG TPA: glycosyltransferase family 2 protein, partial [Chloroflexota bacterium]|nr:glycosyltransferase family 2 protein [Chloroflexota bacterium]